MARCRCGAYNAPMKKTGVMLFVLLTAGAVFAGQPFFFVQLTDTHFGQGDHFALGREAVTQITELPMDIEFVVLAGDIVNDCITDSDVVDRVFQTVDPLQVPVHFLPGNHDILEENIAETTTAFTNAFGRLIAAAEYGGVRCVFVYTEPLTGEVQIPH
jgi:3',5'-cyclic AMP phosphodiesterase CpdA